LNIRILAKVFFKKIAHFFINFLSAYGPPRNGDIQHSCADISKARANLRYTPLFGAATGIKLATEWYFRNLKP